MQVILKTYVLPVCNLSLQMFHIDLDQSTQYIEGLWLFYYFR